MTTNAAPPLASVDQISPSKDLPDPLKFIDGTPVKTKEEWTTKRRPELKRLVQHYIYGFIPPAPGIEAKVTQPGVSVLGGKGTLKEIEIRFTSLPDTAPRLYLAIIFPTAALAKGKPLPVFLAINRCGNQEVIEDDAVTISVHAEADASCAKLPNKGRGSAKDFWCVDYVLERGYAFATFHQDDLDGDKNDFTDGIHPFYPTITDDGTPVPAAARWGTIGAWAWGFHRAIDYLVTDPSIDKNRICIIGHSRRGKTALFAAAMDERVALVVPHQSGTGGMALSRNNDQETVARINKVFPHWFNDIYPTFGDGKEDRLPADQHYLTALIAPRAVLDTEGSRDKWANYDNALKNLQAADKVYQLLGVKGIVGEGVVNAPVKITAENAGNLLQYRRDSIHTLTRDYWVGILDFADMVLTK